MASVLSERNIVLKCHYFFNICYMCICWHSYHIY